MERGRWPRFAHTARGEAFYRQRGASPNQNGKTMSKSVPVRTVLNLGLRASFVGNNYVFDPGKLERFGYTYKQVEALNSALTRMHSEIDLAVQQAAEQIEDMK